MSDAAKPAGKPPFRTIEISDPSLENGDLRFVTVKSRHLGRRADITIHATPAARQTRDAPLVILLHGVYGSHWSWAYKGGAHLTAEKLQATGELPPCVLAMPSDGLWGDGSCYLPHSGADFERWIALETPAAVRSAIPAVTERSPLFIAGLSMGGFGALRIGAVWSDRFRAVSAHSAATHIDQLAGLIEENTSAIGPTPHDRSVFETLARHRDSLPAIRFDCGRDDELLDANRRLHRELVTAGIPHSYEEFPGGHDWQYWREHLKDTLRFFARFMTKRPAGS